jgi:glycosyl transferase family 87
LGTAAQAVRSTLSKPAAVRGLRLPPPALLVLAAVGGCLLLVVAVNRWGNPQDEHAYWLAGQRLLAGAPLYDPTATAVTPYAYWYPPPLAQVVAPVSAVLSSTQFSWAWTGLLLASLLWLGRGRPLVALALVAFVPVAVELWFRNVHLVLAVVVALAILRWPWMFAMGAIVKLAPGLGIVYLLVRHRWRDAMIAAAVGLAIVVASAVLDPGAWAAFLDTMRGRGPGDVSGLVPIPYLVRAVLGLVLTVIAGRLTPRIGEPLLIVAIVVASPTLWLDALAMLAAIVPVAWVRSMAAGESTREVDASRRSGPGADEDNAIRIVVR